MRPRITVVVYDQLSLFEYGCVVEVFALPRPELDVPWYEFSACAAEPGPLRSTAGVTVTATHDLTLLERADTIIVPGWRDPNETPPAALLEKIRAAVERGARVCSICSGAFVLAWAGVLNDHVATTHWRLVDQLAKLFPRVSVEANVLYVDAGSVLTSAGSAAGIDMMLHMVRSDYGPRVASTVARRLVVPAHREGAEAQFIHSPVMAGDSTRLAQLMAWIRANLAAAHTVQSLAERASMSSRTLQRQFQQVTGLSPLDWITRERVLAAKQLLEQTAEPLKVVAAQSGFASQESFRRHFRRLLRSSPAIYRRSFQTA